MPDQTMGHNDRAIKVKTDITPVKDKDLAYFEQTQKYIVFLN